MNNNIQKGLTPIEGFPTFHEKSNYRLRDIISNTLYIFYSIFQCGLYLRAVNITDSLCTKQENLGLKSAVYNQEWFQIKSGL